MNNLANSRLDKLTLALIAGLVFTIPFNLQLPFTNAKVNNFFAIGLALTTAIMLISSREKRREFSQILLLFISLYFAYVAGLAGTNHFQQSVSELTEKKVLFLILPLIIYYGGRLNHQRARLVLITFVVSCVLTLVYCLAIASYRYWVHGLNDFTYHDLSMIAGIKAVYLALHVNFSIAILFYFHNKEWFVWSPTKKALFFVALGVLALSIFLLAARLQIIVFLFGATGYVTYLVSKRTGTFIAMLAACALGILLFGVMLLFPQNRERFKQLINYKGQYGVYGQWGEEQMRPLIWSCAFQLITRKPVMGYGTGDVQPELQNCYVENNYGTLLHFEDMKFNAHNQYLETTIAIGSLGLLIMLANFTVPLVCAIRQKNIIYLIFMCLFAISCLSESLFERHNGIVFFAFFNSFLFFNAKSLK